MHQERNWTYALFNRAGHEVPEYAPEAVRFVSSRLRLAFADPITSVGYDIRPGLCLFQGVYFRKQPNRVGDEHIGNGISQRRGE